MHFSIMKPICEVPFKGCSCVARHWIKFFNHLETAVAPGPLHISLCNTIALYASLFKLNTFSIYSNWQQSDSETLRVATNSGNRPLGRIVTNQLEHSSRCLAGVGFPCLEPLPLPLGKHSLDTWLAQHGVGPILRTP